VQQPENYKKMKNRIRYHSELEGFINNYNISCEKICLVGSVCLTIRGGRRNNDIDIIIDQETYSKIEDSHIPPNISVTNGIYECIDITDEELLTNDQYHDNFERYKIVRPEILASYKHFRRWPKDKIDRDWIGNYIKNNEADWDWDILKDSLPGYEKPIRSQDKPSGMTKKIKKGMLITLDDGPRRTLIETLNEILTQKQRENLANKKLRLELSLNESHEEKFLHPAYLAFHQLQNGVMPEEILDEYRRQSKNKNKSGLIKSGFDQSKAIIINSDYKVKDPDEFVSHVLRHTAPIPTIIQRGSSNNRTNHTCRADENNYDDSTEYRFLNSCGYMPYVILWGSNKEKWDLIENDISSFKECEHSVSKNVKLDSSLGDFIDDIYTYHYNKREWGEFLIQRKKHVLKETNEIRLVMPLVKGFDHPFEIFEWVSKMKQKMREKYSEKPTDVRKILPTPILHTSESFEENIVLQNILESYNISVPLTDGNG